MRWLISLAALAVTPAMAGAPQCANLGPTAIADATALLKAPVHAVSPVAVEIAAPTKVPLPPSVSSGPIPPALAGMPFIQHIAMSGAVIFDLGPSHGVHLVAARSGDQFKVFAVLPDGHAAVEGAPVELGVPQLTTVAAGSVTSLGAREGFDGYFVRSGPQFQVFYAAPDNMVVIPGVLRDAQGKNLTRDQVAKIPGAIPTVEVSGPQAPSPTQSVSSGSAASPVTATEAAIAAVQHTHYGSIGPAVAPQLFMLIDPQCIYSVRSYQALRSYAQSGRIRLSVVPLSVLDYEDHGQSTKTALALLSKPADQLLTAWQFGDVAGPVAADAPERLKQNMLIAEAIGVKGTPTFIWRKTDGTVGRVDGLPTDIGALVSSMGS